MTLLTRRLFKISIRIIVVWVLLIVLNSMFELTIRQKDRIQVLVPGQRNGVAGVQQTHHVNPKLSPNLRNNTFESAPTPVTHIGFLKVHKAASTTTQAIFLRFGWRRNLTFVLSPEFNKFGYPNIISTNESITKYNTLPPPPGKTFDILCNHVVYGKKEWSTILPPDTVMVGTIREPFSHFKSVLNYFNPRNIAFIQSGIDPIDPVGTFLKNPAKYEVKDIQSSFTNNRLSFEYGVDPIIIQNRDFAAFDKYLNDVLDNQFKVVVLAERYDESLVLMKRKLNWSLKDILYALKNVRNSNKADRYELKEEHKAFHKKYSLFDYMLYEFFQEKMSKQIEEEGTSFPEEVENFREIRQFVENFCHTVSRKILSLKIDKSKWTDSFEITRDDCNLMHTAEIAFTQMIRKAQYGSATWGGERRANRTQSNINVVVFR